ncbi:MAG: HAMP domain-containing histidine kinase [Marinosulfonomonas sp.]|nr:HAMP domain-containing histidine kinase [Marinosulfonomonas sp.]
MTAHDLRNPLACIVSTLELLEPKAKNGPKKDIGNAVQRGLRAADRMEDMLQRLMHNTARPAIAPRADTAVCNLRSVMEVVAENNLLAARKKEITFRLSGLEIRARSREELLIQAFDNLVNNAVKYSYFGTEIWCRTGQDARSVFISVSNQGTGLSRKDLSLLGQPFQRLSAIPTGGETSTGLGLWSTRRIADALGGSLTAESGGFNKGATFTLRLPVVLSEETCLSGAGL